MNENLNLIEILKNAQVGTKLYTPVAGEVRIEKVLTNTNAKYPIVVCYGGHAIGLSFMRDGRYCESPSGECLLFPSRDQRDWSKFKPNKPKFDPKTLQEYDKVLVRDANDREWDALLFSHISNKGKLIVAGCAWEQVIPYNDDTKHLVGTTEEAPEYYRYWEE